MGIGSILFSSISYVNLSIYPSSYFFFLIRMVPYVPLEE
jgi:hypothetical protein